MKSRPILFSAPMVRALLNDTKTQTRRVVKNHPYVVDYDVVSDQPSGTVSHGKVRAVFDSKSKGPVACPYGQPGDRLWVWETWGIYDGDGMAYAYPNGIPKTCPEGYHVSYPADDESGLIGEVFKWRPSIHMPRWAIRITLEILSVRVERLQEISEADAIAEGIGKPIGGVFFNYLSPTPLPSGRESYRTLWESINGPGSWESNPFCWVVEFRRVEP